MTTPLTEAEHQRDEAERGTSMAEPGPPEVPERGGEAANETTLQEAERIINGPRRDAYGDAVESFDRIAAGWSVIVGTEVNGTQVALCMDWLKTCRFLSAVDRDSLVDKGGYTGLAARLAKIDP